MQCIGHTIFEFNVFEDVLGSDKFVICLLCYFVIIFCGTLDDLGIFVIHIYIYINVCLCYRIKVANTTNFDIKDLC